MYTRCGGIGCINKKICINKSFKNHLIDPVESFVNRLFSRYNIKRNNYNENSNEINNVIYVKNKRVYKGVNEIFDTLNKLYDNIQFKCIDWSKYNFEQQLKILNSTKLIICGVGTARANSPLLPNGSIEIQTNDYNKNKPNNVCFFDTHLGTISNYLKVINIEEYTNDECKNNFASKELINCIENALKKIPYRGTINVEHNIPSRINKDKLKMTDKQFNTWRNTYSNNVEDMYKYI